VETALTRPRLAFNGHDCGGIAALRPKLARKSESLGHSRDTRIVGVHRESENVLATSARVP
jgi:hypothetical protein